MKLVELCKCKFLYYEEYYTYQGVCPDCLGLVVLFFFFLPYVCTVLHSTGNTGTSYKVLNTFIWGRKDPLFVYLKIVPLKCQGKDGFFPLICFCADHFLQRGPIP